MSNKVSALPTASSPLAATDIFYVVQSGASKQVAQSALCRGIAPTTLYVRTDGSDSNTGLANTAGAAFLTIQHACDVLATYDVGTAANGSISVADGTYTAGAAIYFMPVGGGITITGNTTTPGNVIINPTGADCFGLFSPGYLGLSGMKLTTTTSGHGISAGYPDAVVQLTGAMEFGTLGGTSAHMIISAGAFLFAQSVNYTINGNAAWHLFAHQAGRIIHGFNTVTLTGTPAFSQSFAVTINQGFLESQSTTFTGAATGKRYAATAQSLIYVAGGGANYFPGDVAGTPVPTTLGTDGAYYY